MTVISYWMGGALHLAEALIQTMLRESPSIVMCQDVPYLTDEELENLFQDRMSIEYNIYRKHAGELNRVANHIADNFMIIRSHIKVEPIFDDDAREWMQLSSVNIFCVIMKLSEREAPGIFVTLEDEHKVAMFSVLVHEPITEDDARQNVCWISRLLDKEGLDPLETLVMGYFYDDTFPRMLESETGISVIGDFDSSRNNQNPAPRR